MPNFFTNLLDGVEKKLEERDQIKKQIEAEEKLIEAVSQGNFEAIRTLLNKGVIVNPNIKDDNGKSLFDIAKNNHRVLYELYLGGVNIPEAKLDKDTKFDFVKLAIWDQGREDRRNIGPETFEKLINMVDNLNSQDNRGYTLLGYAVQPYNNSYYASMCIDPIVKHGADPNVGAIDLRGDKTDPPLFKALDMADRGQVNDTSKTFAALALINNEKTDINIPNKYGDYPIHIAIKNGLCTKTNYYDEEEDKRYVDLSINITEAIINRGADLNKKDKNGKSVMELALQIKSDEVAALTTQRLIEKGLKLPFCSKDFESLAATLMTGPRPLLLNVIRNYYKENEHTSQEAPKIDDKKNIKTKEIELQNSGDWR